MRKITVLSFILILALLFTGCDLIGGLFGGGETDTIPLTPQNLFFVGESDRETAIGSGTEPMVDMWFTSPQDFGATSYTLQSSTDNGVTWGNYDHYGNDVVTSTESETVGFSVSPASASWFRLMITGGTYDGQFSNAMEVPVLSSIPTRFSGWSIDESVGNTGTMAPNAGYGLAASFSVTGATSPYPPVAITSTNLTYQWYRVNPADFEDIELITGATSLNYTTTNADKGHILMIRATGDEDTIGGFIQAMSSNVVK